jgi:hypothetical protein
LGGQLGSVDYLIAHGLYSWVPERVRESVLSLCGRMLSDRGLAFISFNALPGSHSRSMIREMLRRHVGMRGSVEERIGQARGLLAFLHAAAEGAPGHRGTMRPEYERLLQGSPAQLVHDEMSDCHEAFYFSDFMARAAVHGLDFVANAEVVDSGLAGFPAEVQEILGGMDDDDFRREQYIDYARLRSFRQVLLCRKGAFRRGPEDGPAGALSPGSMPLGRMSGRPFRPFSRAISASRAANWRSRSRTRPSNSRSRAFSSAGVRPSRFSGIGTAPGNRKTPARGIWRLL